MLAALRQGLRRVCFTGSRAAAAKLSAIAEAQGAEVVARPRRALDLRGVADPEAALILSVVENRLGLGFPQVAGFLNN